MIYFLELRIMAGGCLLAEDAFLLCLPVTPRSLILFSVFDLPLRSLFIALQLIHNFLVRA